MSFPPLAGGDHTILSSEFCSGYVDTSGVWNTGFYCPQTGSVLAVYCCGTPTYKYCCTTKPINGTGAGIVEEFIFGGSGGPTTHSRPTGTITENGGDDVITLDGSGGNDYSGATRMRPPPSSVSNEDLNNSDLTSLNLSDVPIIFGVACGVAAVLILVILVVFYLTSCCAHYHKLAQNRKRRSSSMPGIYRGVTTTNTSTTSGLVNLYSPTHSSVGTSIVGGGGSLASGLGGAIASTSQDNTQTYIVHHHHHNSGSNPPGSPDSSNAAPEHYQLGGMGASTSLVTTPLDIEWSSTTQYLQKPQQAIMTSSGHQLHHQQPLNLLSNHIIAATTDNRIHYTVHQTQNRLAVALTGSMNRLSDHRSSAGSPCPNPATSSSYPVNIPLTSPDMGYNYPRQIFSRGLSPPPQYSRAESPPYYPSYGEGVGGGLMGDSLQQQQHHNYLSRTSTLPLSLARKPPSGASGNRTPLVTSPLGTSYMSASQQPKSILRTSENFRRVVTNETPPPIPPHNTNSSFTFGGGGSMEGGIGSIAYRSVDSRTNLSSQPLLILESNVESSANKDVQVPPTLATSAGGQDEEEEDEDDGEDSGLHTATLIRRSSISTGVGASSGGNDEEEEEERRDQFDIHDIDSDAFSRLLEIDCDSKL